MDFSVFPRATLGIFPTPLHSLPRLGRALGHPSLYIKRDDMTGLSVGGNKTRSLEFLLGDALRKGCDTIITAGGLQSNLCPLTAAACARLGLSCVLVHNGNKPERLSGNLLLNDLFGAESYFLGDMPEDERTAKMVEIAERLEKEGRRTYVVHNGASTPLGALGYARCAAELNKQAEQAGIHLRHVVIVGAMGGTASGFVFGTAMLRHPFHVHVVSVEYPKVVLESIILDLTSGLERLFRDFGVPCKPLPVSQVMTVYDEYIGPGYAVPSNASLRAHYDVARYEGILTEHVYTAKTASGFIDLVNRGAIPKDEAACFIHTGGVGAFFSH